eukprot:5031479-Pyramimonas_sp.AAC.1
MGASWGRLGASRVLRRASLGGALEFAVRGPCLGLFLGRFAALLGRLGRLLGHVGVLLGCLWGLLGASWAVLGWSWEPRWGLVGGFQRREGLQVGYAENARFPTEISRCWFLRGFLGGLSEASWGVLAASGAVLSSFWESWNDLSATLGSRGPSWRLLGRRQ